MRCIYWSDASDHINSQTTKDTQINGLEFNSKIMSESQRLRQLLTNIQREIMRLGSNNRDRWAVFSTDTELTQQQFASRLACFGFSVPPGDIATLWRATEVPRDRMQFGDFIRFLQTEGIHVPDVSPSTVSPSGLLETMKGNRRALLMKFVESDPTTTGQVTHRAFADICSWFGSAENQSDIKQLISQYDPLGTGVIEYFSLMSDLCYMKRPPGLQVPSSPKQTYDTTRSPTQMRSPTSDRSRTAPQREFTTPTRSPVSPRLDTSFSRSPMGSPVSPRTGYNTSSGGRGKLDPAIFGCSSPPRSPGTSSGGRGRLDPAIFGQRTVSDDLPEQPMQRADDCINAERVSGLTPNQYIELISKQVSRISRGSKQCYAKWRGGHNLLDANDIRDGLAKDANILVPLRDIEMIVNHYGGPMNMSTFVRMLADGTRYAEQNSTIEGMKRVTEDEAVLMRISEQVIGTQWESLVLRSRSAEDIVRVFAEMGAEVTESEIGTLTSKLGKTGLVDAIKARIQM